MFAHTGGTDQQFESELLLQLHDMAKRRGNHEEGEFLRRYESMGRTDDVTDSEKLVNNMLQTLCPTCLKTI